MTTPNLRQAPAETRSCEVEPRLPSQSTTVVFFSYQKAASIRTSVFSQTEEAVVAADKIIFSHSDSTFPGLISFLLLRLVSKAHLLSKTHVVCVSCFVLRLAWKRTTRKQNNEPAAGSSLQPFLLHGRGNTRPRGNRGRERSSSLFDLPSLSS